MEISGNRKVRERLNELGVNKISGIFDYNSDEIQKLKSEIAERVMEILKIELGTASTETNSNGNINTNNSGKLPNAKNSNDESSNNSNKIKKIENVNFDDVKVETPKSEVKEATKFKNYENNNLNVKITSATNDNKGRKINKIQKVDFDFDFDNFGDTNFSTMNIKEDEDKNDKADDQWIKEEKETKKSYFKNDDEEEERHYNKPKMSKDEINKKFANKKAISSDDYKQLEENPSEKNYYKSKINSMKNYQAISSSDVYGETEDGKHY